MAQLWVVAPGETSDAWLTLRDPFGFWQAGVKWSGCVHLTKYDEAQKWEGWVDGAAEGTDYMHICDLDVFIAQLEELRRRALEHFQEWPG